MRNLINSFQLPLILIILLTIGSSQLSERPIIYSISENQDNVSKVRATMETFIFKEEILDLENRINVIEFHSKGRIDNFYIANDKETGLQYFFYQDSLDNFTQLDWKEVD